LFGNAFHAKDAKLIRKGRFDKCKLVIPDFVNLGGLAPLWRLILYSNRATLRFPTSYGLEGSSHINSHDLSAYLLQKEILFRL